MNKCDFCKEIYDYNELINMWHWDRQDLIISTVLCYDKEEKTYNIWYECQDSYYSDKIMEIQYCPICGRELRV